MISGYIQVSLIIALLILIMFLLIIIHTRFGLKKHTNWKWTSLFIVVLISSLSSSIIKYPEVWKEAVKDLQLVSLASIFSGIAAFLVVAQISNKTAVYTKLSATQSDKIDTVLLKVNQSRDLDFKIINVSKITANDVVIQCLFSNAIKVESINIPAWSSVINDGHGFEVHLDTDKSYNPIHSNMSKGFTVRINSKEINHTEAVIIRTIAKDTNWGEHSFMVSTNKSLIENKKYIEFIKKIKIPLYAIIKNHFRLLKYMIIAIILISLSPYIYDLLI